MLTAKLDGVEKLFDEQTLEAAQQRFRGGIGLQELLLEAAWANGYTGRNFRDSRAVLRFAFQPELEAGFSTIDIGGILSNVANKFLLEGFFSVERTWRNICAVRNVSRLQDRHQLPADRQGPVRAGRPRRRAQARHAGQRDLHQQGRHLRPDALDRPPGHHQRRPGRDHHGAAEAGPRLGPEDQRRVLGHVPGQRRVLHRRQQELPDRRRHGAGDRRPDQGRGGLHGPGRHRRQADRHHAGDPAGAHGAVGHGARSSTSRWRSATPRPARSTRSPTRTRASSAPRSAATWPTATTPATRARPGTCWPTRATCR